MRLFQALCGVAMVAVPFAAHAQKSGGTGALGFGVIGGATFPVGDYDKVAKTGFHAGGFVDFGRRVGPFGIRADVLYHGFGDRNLVTSGSNSTAVTISNKYSMVTGTLNAVLGIPLQGSPVRPYVTGGVGAYYLKNSPKCAVSCNSLLTYGQESSTKLGFNGGGGIEFGLGGTGVFIESRFHHVINGTPKFSCFGQSGCNRAALQIVPLSVGVRIQM